MPEEAQDLLQMMAGVVPDEDEDRATANAEVAEAKAAGRAEALLESGVKLVAAEIKAAAAGRIEADKLAVLLESLNLSGFMTEAGDVDAAKVQAFVDTLTEATTETPKWPELGGAVLDNPILNHLTHILGT